MEELIQRCAGIDVGQSESVACVRVPDAVTGAPAELISSSGTTTSDDLPSWSKGCADFGEVAAAPTLTNIQ